MKPFGLEDIVITLVDVAAEARLMYGEAKAEEIAKGKLPPSDIRIQARAIKPGRSVHMTFHNGAKLSAEDILAAMNGDK